MIDENTRRRREAEIFAAAYELLAQHGYGGTSMLRVARAARASNETLYRWYGDKDGLFTAMVRENAAEIRRSLEAALKNTSNPWETIEAIAPAFLRMLLGDRAILLNRAAAADPSGKLGAVISAGGRNEIQPLINGIIGRLDLDVSGRPDQLATWFVSLLVGDLQVRRIIHNCTSPSESEIASRCQTALSALRWLARLQ